jgi:TolB protein
MKNLLCYVRSLLGVVGAFTCVTAGHTQTDLYVRGAGKLIPLATPRLCLEAGEKGPDGDIPSVLAKDLDLSGYFEVLDPKSYLETPGKCGAVENTTFSDWSVIGTEGLIKGRVSVSSRGQVNAQLYLLDVQKQTAVLAKQYDGELSQVKLIAHKFANEVMKYYTGFSGVFGTEIAFSSLNRRENLFLLALSYLFLFGSDSAINCFATLTADCATSSIAMSVLIGLLTPASTLLI